MFRQLSISAVFPQVLQACRTRLAVGGKPSVLGYGSWRFIGGSTSRREPLQLSLISFPLRYPRRTVILDWDAETSTTSILRTFTTRMHGSLINSVDRAFFQQIPKPEQFLLYPVRGCGHLAPDFTLRFDAPPKISPGELDTVPILVAEVGFVERKENFEKLMHQWFDRYPTINVGFLFKVDENPQYQRPLKFQTHRKDSVFLQNPEAVSFSNHIVFRDGEKALYLSDFQLMGETKAYMEFWARDQKTGKAMKTGDRIEFYGYEKPAENFRIKYNQFVPSNDPVYQTEFVLDWTSIEKTITRDRYLGAKERRDEIIFDYKEIEKGE